MYRLTAADLPKDHPYYRSSSEGYRKYLETCGLRTLKTSDGYAWLKNVLGFHIAKFERLEAEPDIAALKAAGFGPGVVIWIPARRTEIPKPWRKMWLRSHFMNSGFTVVDSPDYFRKWNERARRARKKFLSTEGAETVRVSDDEFMEHFRTTPVRHAFKKEYIKYYRTMAAIAPESVRSYVAKYRGKVVAGLAVFDYCGNSSAHLVAFTGPEAYSIQAGTGLIDRWFADSWTSGVKYVNFDHLKDPSMTPDQQGYTDFKKNFMEYSIEYPDSYFRFVA